MLKTYQRHYTGFDIWKWGFNFNEGSSLGSWIPIVLIVNSEQFWLYLALGLPYLCYGRDLGRDSQDKIWFIAWKGIFRIIWKKDKK